MASEALELPVVSSPPPGTMLTLPILFCLVLHSVQLRQRNCPLDTYFQGLSKIWEKQQMQRELRSRRVCEGLAGRGETADQAEAGSVLRRSVQRSLPGSRGCRS